MAALLLAACGSGTEVESGSQPTDNSDLSTAGTEPVATEIVKLRIGDLGIVGNGPTYIAIEAGYFADEGLEIELQPFRSAVDMIPLLGQGRLDAGLGTPSAALYNALNEGIELRVVADAARVATGVRSHLALVIGRSKSDQVRDFADLVGMRIAINAPAGGLEVQLVRALERGGLKLNDVTVVHLAFPEMIAALENGSVDAAITLEPFLSLGLDAGSFVEFAAVSEFYPNHQIAVMVISPQLAEREDVSVRFVRAYLRGVRDFREALIDGTADPTDVINTIIKYTPMKDLSLYDRMAYHDVDPDGLLNLDSIDSDLRYYLKAGYIASIPSLESFIDLGFIEAARSSIGGYGD